MELGWVSVCMRKERRFVRGFGGGEKKIGKFVGFWVIFLRGKKVVKMNQFDENYDENGSFRG